MTEDNAKTKWCPMRRMTEVGNVRMHNTEPNAPFTLNCIGSACMMWREIRYIRTGVGDNTFVPEPSGYCGLAGKP